MATSSYRIRRCGEADAEAAVAPSRQPPMPALPAGNLTHCLIETEGSGWVAAAPGGTVVYAHDMENAS